MNKQKIKVCIAERYENMPVFSIVVPVYKVEKYLDKCVQSLINQTFTDIEIILVDDGSPDGCPALCDGYAKADSRIRVIHKPNGGLSDARNAGMDTARGAYILLVDSDDYVETDTCEKLYPFTQTECDIIIAEGITEGGYKHLYHGNAPQGQVCDAKSYLKIACGNNRMPMASWLYVYKRAFLEQEKLRFKKGILHEDEEFTPRVFLAAQQVVESGVVFYHYVIRGNSITTQKDLRKNDRDLYETCLALRKQYATLSDLELRWLLQDSLVVKLLNMFQQGKLYIYGKTYLHKQFIWENALRWKTKCKALLFCLSPKLYWHINYGVKRFLR